MSHPLPPQGILAGDGPPPDLGGKLLTPEAAARKIDQLVGMVDGVVRDDPAFGPRGDPIRSSSRPTAKVIYRDIPLVVVQNSWSVHETIAALSSHMMGYFDRSGQLVDSILGDDRVIATLGSRRAGLFGREVRFKPANDSAAAKEVLDAWVNHWPSFSGDSSLGIMSDYEVLMGFCNAQLVWDTRESVWKPFLKLWHPRYVYWNWAARKMVALSQDGSVPIIAGNGKWVHHSRFGYERSWIRGAIRGVAEPFLGRHFARRDWMRWSELHGIPMVLAETPMAADPIERSQFVNGMANRGSETVILIGKGVDEHNSYGVSLVEAETLGWEGFAGLVDQCDMAIQLALLFQNLTTEVKGGSFAATSAHMDIRDSGIQDDNVAWRSTIHDQVARPFAAFGFGDPDLAPWTDWDVASRSGYEQNATQFKEFGTALEVMARAGIRFDDDEAVRAFAKERFGLDKLPKFTIHDPPTTTTANAAMLTAQAADKSAGAAHKTGDAAIISANANKTKAEKPEPTPPPKGPSSTSEGT